MIVDVFQLTPDGVLDPSAPVAEVHFEAGQTRVNCTQDAWKPLLEELFLADGGRFKDTGGADSLEQLEQGSEAHLRHLLEEELYGFSLAGRVRTA